jgi:hypothetical protein
LAIDRDEGNTLWYDSLRKELEKIMVAFDTQHDKLPEMICGDSKLLSGYQEIRCHWIFDVKMELTRKSRFVAGGHTTTTPSQTYSSVVSRDSVRLAFIIAALNGLDLRTSETLTLMHDVAKRFGLKLVMTSERTKVNVSLLYVRCMDSKVPAQHGGNYYRHSWRKS